MSKQDKDDIEWITVGGKHIPLGPKTHSPNETKADPRVHVRSEDKIPFDKSKGEKPKLPKQVFGFGKGRRDTKHHTRHMRDMGFRDAVEYEKTANRFWETGEGTTYYGNRRNNFAKYNPKTQEYVIVQGDNVKSFYKMTQKQFEEYKKREGYEEWKE